MSQTINLIPNPVSIQYKTGIFQVKGIPNVQNNEEFHSEIKIFQEQIQKTFGEFANSSLIICIKDNSIRESGYRIQIENEKISVFASSASGIYHGLQSLRQLFLSEYKNGEIILPHAIIEDYPHFSWRGFMLDCARHFYTKNFIKKIIDILSMHHISKFHWHTTDDQGWRFPVKKYPLLTEIGSRRKNLAVPKVYYEAGFYTEEDIREIVKYAGERHIEVIPEVDIPGHTSSVLACYPGLGCTGGPYQVEDRHGIFEDVLCAGNDAIFDLASACFETLSELFPSKYVHIGGDEVLFERWAECPKCQKRLSDTGLTKAQELQSWITVRLVEMLSERGKIAIGWDEILEDTNLFKLPKSAVVMSWRGTKAGKKASELGYNVIMSPTTEGCYLDYKHLDVPEEIGQFWGISTIYQIYNMMNKTISEMDSNSVEGILGAQGNLWSELIYADRIAEYMIFPRICALAESVWTPFALKDFEDFTRRLEIHRKRLDLLDVIQYRGDSGFKKGKD